jgi:membrane-associated phospholipid phosphatase
VTSNIPGHRRFILSAILALAAVAALSIDVPVVMAIRHWTDPASAQRNRTIDNYFAHIDVFETFGHGAGVLLILFMVHQLDPARRWAIPRLAACAFASGGAADLVKLLLARTRPYDLPLGFHDSVWATFHQWFPGFSDQGGLQSFPSAHTATAVGLAAGLIWLYPQGRTLFIALAVLVGCQRITARAHFPSDVCFGAALGAAISTLLLYAGPLPALFARWESRWLQQIELLGPHELRHLDPVGSDLEANRPAQIGNQRAAADRAIR